MSDDLVKRLRATTQHLASSTYVDLSMWQSHSSACFEAADAIERLAADNAILSKWHIDAEARAEAAERKVEKLRRALTKLLARDERNTCQHDETHRGGVLWEICDSCGAQWADDEGGKPEWKDPSEWTAARAALAETENGDE